MIVGGRTEDVAYLCADGSVRQGYRLGDARPLRTLGRIQYAWDRTTDDGQIREYVTTAGFLVRDGQLSAANVAATLHFERVLDVEHVEEFVEACETRGEEISSEAAANCDPARLRGHAADASSSSTTPLAGRRNIGTGTGTGRRRPSAEMAGSSRASRTGSTRTCATHSKPSSAGPPTPTPRSSRT
ncbi:hypothetical protein [Halogeometricum sp. CBA1124]|uniref:hypothetical protein n=1 Tax=Halogeometricum sp. CBA1124 TaxID=2668071 RepID=UPI001E3349EC|nr:hypothetical protein [Halogeometricum sp. CBA1124]